MTTVKLLFRFNCDINKHSGCNQHIAVSPSEVPEVPLLTAK